MASSDQATDWVKLLAEPGGPEGVYDHVLRRAQLTAADPEIQPNVSGVDEPLAAVALLRGPNECREIMGVLAPALVRLGRKLAMFPASVNTHSQLAILSLSALSVCIGARISLPEFDSERAIVELLTSKTFTLNQDVTLALLLLEMGRLKDAKLLLAKRKSASKENPVAFLTALAANLESRVPSHEVDIAWRKLLDQFPTLVANEASEWRQLLLAARLVLGRLGDTPEADVAEVLHRMLIGLAAEKRA